MGRRSYRSETTYTQLEYISSKGLFYMEFIISDYYIRSGYGTGENDDSFYAPRFANKKTTITKNPLRCTYSSEGIIQMKTYGRSPQTFSMGENMYMFAMNRNNQIVKSPMTGSIYSFTISENGIVYRDFKPVLRNSDNVAGMLDTVNNVFYKSLGSQNFIP